MARVLSLVLVGSIFLCLSHSSFPRFPAVNREGALAKSTRSSPFAFSWRTRANVQSANSQRIERQSDCTRSSDFRERMTAIECNAEYLKAVNDVECFFYAIVPFFGDFAKCGLGTNNTFCRVHETSDVTPFDVASDVIQQCIEGSRNCSNSCKTTLENFSERFGCCIHSDGVTRIGNLIRALTPQLWSDCGVPRPEPCGNVIMPQSATNSSCSYTCSLNQFHALFCKYQAEDMMALYRECGEEKVALRLAQSCGFNNRGEFCATVGSVHSISSLVHHPRDELDQEYLEGIYDKCIDFALTGNCPAECRKALLDAKDRFGCCFNNINGSAIDLSTTFFYPVSEDGIRSFVTDNNLWSACVVEPPGLCQFPNVGVFDELTQCSVCQLDSDDDLTILALSVSAGIVVLLLLLTVPVTIIICCYHKRYINGSVHIISNSASQLYIYQTDLLCAHLLSMQVLPFSNDVSFFQEISLW